MVTVKAPTNRRHHRGVPLKSAKGSMDMMSAYIARAGGYCGSDPNFRGLVADAKALWCSQNHRGRRPAVWSPDEASAAMPNATSRSRC
jgi:hypothetical protein